MLKTLKVTTPSDREIVMTRSFNAPRHVVWQAMTTPDLIRRWLFGPPGWEMTTCEEELRIGGKFRWAWRGPNGEEMAMHGVYREIAAPERLVRTECFDFGCPAQAGEQVGTLLLKEDGGKTLLTLRVEFPSKEARDGAIASGMEHGVSAGYDRLEEMLAGPTAAPPRSTTKLDLVMTRIFEAPLELVWRAWTEADLVKRWWGPDRFSCPRARMDVRVGGKSLVCMRAPKEFGGRDMYSTWEYRAVEPLRRLEYIHNLSDDKGNPIDPTTLGLPPDFPQSQRHVIEFKALGNSRTEITMTEYAWTPGQMMEMSKMGLAQCLDKMAAALANG